MNRTMCFAVLAVVALTSAVDGQGSFPLPPTSVSGGPGVGAGDKFGGTIAADGDYAVLGVHCHDFANEPNAGVAIFYERDQQGAWTEAGVAVSPTPFDDDILGWSVDVSGNRAIIGVPYDDDQTTNGDFGAAFIYERNAQGNWLHTDTLRQANPNTFDGLGNSVGLAQDIAAVGVQFDDVPGTVNVGSVVLFDKTPSGWQEGIVFFGPNPQLDAKFGETVAVDTDLVVAGSPSRDEMGSANAGAVFVYEKQGSNWSFSQKLLAPTVASGARFGEALAVQGDLIAVGAWRVNSGAGAVYLFRKDTSNLWTHEQTLTASVAGAGHEFGRSIALSSQGVFVGSPGDGGQGAAYTFTQGPAGVWTESSRVLASNGLPGDDFGDAIAVAGNEVLVGAPWATPCGSTVDTGSVYKLLAADCSPAFQRGDCNNDGAKNIADAVRLLSFLFPPTGTSIVLDCPNACDANDDDSLNIADAVAALNVLFPTSTPIPWTTPDLCGIDPTPGVLTCTGYTNCP